MKRIIILAFIIILISGCTVEYNDGEKQVSYEVKDISQTQYSDWTAASKGLDIKQFLVGDQNLVTVLRIDNNSFEWAIAQDTFNTKLVSTWRQQLKADVAINGGYFDENNESTGYLFINDKSFGNLSLDGRNGYTGMLTIKDGKPALRYLPDENFSKDEDIDFALQTFPTLIYNGKSLIEKDSGKTARRTVLAKGNDQKFYIIISEFFISLFELADWLENSEINLAIAMNLDGGPSTGLIVKNDEFYYKADSAPVPNVIYLKKILDQ